jgi:HEPN domain-containing protein
MKPRDAVRRQFVAEWIRKADLDFDSASQLAAVGDRFREVVAFHAQQASEKYLKALLVRHEIDPPKTHDLETLLERLQPFYRSETVAMRPAAALSPFGVEIRYPSDAPELLPGGQEEVLRLARIVRDTVMPLVTPFLGTTGH